MAEEYRPISCDFHDELEARATTGQNCQIVYAEEDGGEVTVNDRIADLYTREHEEFVRLAGGKEIRLDRIRRVDGNSLSPETGGKPGQAVL